MEQKLNFKGTRNPLNKAYPIKSCGWWSLWSLNVFGKLHTSVEVWDLNRSNGLRRFWFMVDAENFGAVIIFTIYGSLFLGYLDITLEAHRRLPRIQAVLLFPCQVARAAVHISGNRRETRHVWKPWDLRWCTNHWKYRNTEGRVLNRRTIGRLLWVRPHFFTFTLEISLSWLWRQCSWMKVERVQISGHANQTVVLGLENLSVTAFLIVDKWYLVVLAHVRNVDLGCRLRCLQDAGLQVSPVVTISICEMSRGSVSRLIHY